MDFPDSIAHPFLRTIEISSTHLSDTSLGWLSQAQGNRNTPLIVYNKGDYGWFIYIPDSEEPIDMSGIPGDLAFIIGALFSLRCSLLIIDSDVTKDSFLYLYG